MSAWGVRESVGCHGSLRYFWPVAGLRSEPTGGSPPDW